MEQSSLSTPARLLARYLREKHLANLSHTQALEALAQAHNVSFKAHKAKETAPVKAETTGSPAERLKTAEGIVELLYQTLGDWKPDELRRYGLDALFELAQAYPVKLDLISEGRVQDIIADVQLRARSNEFIVTSYDNALELATESAHALGLEATAQELEKAAEALF